jgi:26S proteasome regulatory subunit T5
MDDSEILQLSNEELQNRIKLLENDIKIMRQDQQRLTHEHQQMKLKIKDNVDKIKLSKQLPYLVANIVEV